MRKGRILLFGALGLLLWCLAPAARAGMLLRKTVQQMCFTSDWIVSGMHLGGGKVRVDKLFHASLPLGEKTKLIEVPSIPKHSKVIDGIFRANKDAAPIATNRVVLFLTQGKDGALAPSDMIGEGSQGLFWYDDEACYGYTQVMNPGPYTLMQSRPGKSQGRIPAGKAEMWKQIQVGLELRSQWEAIEAVEDPAERARRMAAYLLPHTAPEGYAQALDLRRFIGKIGPEAVPPLIAVLEKARPEEDLNTTLLTLLDIGSVHPGSLRPAVPALCELFGKRGTYSLYYLLSPVTAAGDPRAIPYVRPMLEQEGKQVRGQAARALAAMKDQESFDGIAALIEESTDPADRTGYTLELARSLFELDPVRARPIIERVESKPGNAGLHHFIAGCD